MILKTALVVIVIVVIIVKVLEVVVVVNLFILERLARKIVHRTRYDLRSRKEAINMESLPKE